MNEETFLSDEFSRQITAAGEVDILVGVPTLNNSKTIERVIRAIQVGLVKYFPRERAALVSPDGGSKDGTPELTKGMSVQDFRTLLSTPPLRTMHTLTTSYRDLWGKGGALQTILAAADLLRAKACAIISPDLESITPEWIDALIRPVYRENFDFVAPLYLRPKFDGLLIKHILSPFITAAYGYAVQEPYGEELAFSGRLATHYLSQDVFRQNFMRLGAEIWMTTTAMSGGFRLCQSYLGPKIHASTRRRPDPAMTIQQVLGCLFNCLEIHQAFWVSREQVETVPAFGFEQTVGLRPVRVERKRMHQMFQVGVEELASVLESILAADTLQRIREVAKLSDGEFCLPDDLWVRAVYEFAVSFHRSVMSRDHILQALMPLYRGRISSFINENHEADSKHFEERLKALRVEYERLKPYLIECWRASQ
ncbi:MAG: glycosyltransferase [Terriglobia bacterium]